MSFIKEPDDDLHLVFGVFVMIAMVVLGSMAIFSFYDHTLLSATDVEKLDLSGCEAQELKKILLLHRTPLNNADVREARFLCHRATAENEHNRLLDDLLFQQNKALGDR